METYEIIASAIVGLISLTFIGYGVRLYLKRDDEKLQAKIQIENKQDYYMSRVMVCHALLCIIGGLYMSLIYFGLALPLTKGAALDNAMITKCVVIVITSFLLAFVYGFAMRRWARKPKDEQEDEERKNGE